MGSNYDNVTPTSDPNVMHLDTLDVNIPPDLEALACTEHMTWKTSCNSYYPSLGSSHLREVVSRHVSNISGCCYLPEKNCIITAGGSSSGLASVFLATVTKGDEVILTDPTYGEHFSRVVLTGADPIFVPFIFRPGAEWILDEAKLRDNITAKTRVLLLMSPSFPSGGYLSRSNWQLVAQLCLQHDLILVIDASMERLVFDNRPVLHPAGLRGMEERTITIGSASKELRMIGWRVGWIVGPEKLMRDIRPICRANTLAPTGIAQEPVALALERSSMTLGNYIDKLQERRDCLLTELSGLPVGVPAGGWGMFLRVSDFGHDSKAAYAKLLKEGVVVNVDDWVGKTHASQYVCIIFSNASSRDLEGVGSKIRRALGARNGAESMGNADIYVVFSNT